MNISIVIPTYNGENRISKALDGIKNLIVPEGVICEFLLIDNNSTDNTIEVVNSYNLNFKIIKESKQGLFFARDRGIKESNSNWIFFIDDDIKVQPNWVIEFIEVIKNNPMAGLIAAPLKFPVEYKISDIINEYKSFFAITDTYIEESLKYNCLASMFCVNKECYNFLLNNGFDQKFKGRGYLGNPLAGGEDIEYSLAIKYTPYHNCITTKTFGYHYLDQSRLTYEYCLSVQNLSGFTKTLLAPLKLSDRSMFKNMTSYYYTLFRAIYFYFKSENTKEKTNFKRKGDLSFIKHLLKYKKEYQNYEKEIKNAKWNVLNEEN